MVSHLETILDEDSRHLAADLFLSVPAGCYTVWAIPADTVNVNNPNDWTPSADCSSADTGVFEVVDGQTTETAPMISQCVGDPVGAFDATVVINNPPVISVDVDEKYNYECESVEACVTTYDPNDDPISIVFAKTGGGGLFYIDQGTPEVVGFDDGHRIWEQCATIVTQYTGSYDITATVWDHTATGTTRSWPPSNGGWPRAWRRTRTGTCTSPGTRSPPATTALPSRLGGTGAAAR